MPNGEKRSPALQHSKGNLLNVTRKTINYGRHVLTLETGVSLDKLVSVRYYGGFPMSAQYVIAGVKAKIEKAA